MADNSSQPKVKNVPPYPIAISVSKGEGQPVSRGHIVKLAEHGFMMKIDLGPVFKVGEEWILQFETPALHSHIKTIGKVMKTYDAYDIRGTEKIKMYTIEMHFKSLTKDQKDAINNYLVHSGQKKRVLI